ncbi:SRPBCC family protein [Mycolicibacterium thermoresistibile]
MELINEFRVPVPAEQAWDVLTDVERIAPCIPGATLLSVDGDDFTGQVKVKVGPITVQYKGKASFEQKDTAARRAVIRANGKETRGQGNAAAVVTAELKEEGDSTLCILTTDLTISGKAAQFGRGVLADVAGKLIGQFAERLEADVLSQHTTAPAPQGSADEPAVQPAPVAAPTPAPAADASVNMLALVAVPIAKRVAPVAAGLAVGLALGWVLGRRSGGAA